MEEVGEVCAEAVEDEDVFFGAAEFGVRALVPAAVRAAARPLVEVATRVSSQAMTSLVL